jgi:hypothetical protein
MTAAVLSITPYWGDRALAFVIAAAVIVWAILLWRSWD